MKKKKTFKEPSPKAMAVSALFSISLGLFLATFLLVTTPTSRLSREPELGAKLGNFRSFYIPGKTAKEESASFGARMQRFMKSTPGQISFEEEELNKFFVSQMVDPDAPPETGVRVGNPNVRISADRMIVTFPLVLDPGNTGLPILAQMYMKVKDERLVLDRMLLNSLPVPGAVAVSMLGSKMEEGAMPSDYLDAWSAVEEVSIDNGQITLTVVPAGV